VKRIDYVPSVTQQKFHDCNEREALFGTLPGGGKTTALFMDAVTRCLENPGMCAHIFKRTHESLQNSLVALVARFVPESVATYDAASMLLDFENGSRIYFAHCEKEEDVLRFSGRVMNALYIDNLQEFTKSMYEALRNSVRARYGKKLVIRCTAKYVGEDSWIHEYFSDADSGRKIISCSASPLENTYLSQEYLAACDNVRARFEGDFDGGGGLEPESD
jgi:phage terminase large subunit